MDDLISRREAIDALNGLCDRECEYSKKQRYVMCNACHLGSAFDVIEELPTQTNKLNTLGTLDCVERQAVIGAIVNKVSDIGLHDNSEVARYGATFRQHEIIDIIESLPSAHLEIEERKEESAQNVPKEDLISRNAAIEAMSESLKRVFPEHRQIAEKCLKALPSAQPEPQWIPVSERLPEVGRSVLFSRRSMCTREGCLQADGKWWQYWWYELLNADQVTAWKPLPKPYKEDT